jgi:hypothetical protein
MALMTGRVHIKAMSATGASDGVLSLLAVWRDFKTGEVIAQELYDNQSDPLETVNLADTEEAKARIPALAAQLKTMAKGTQP